MAGKKNRMTVSGTSMAEAFEEYVTHKKAAGLAPATVAAYKAQFRAIAKYLDTRREISEYGARDLKRLFSELSDTDLSRNSIRSYSACLQAFFSWCRAEGLSDLTVQLFRGEETVPETYTDDELRKLLKHPARKRPSFTELRSWTVVNLLVNNGVRSATVRAIRCGDVYLDRHVILLRHMKARKLMSIPLSDTLVSVLKEYLRARKGKDQDYLFCNVAGEQLTSSGLRCSIARYNRSRGVRKTSVHAFRHTFARLYLVDCGGDALKLQRLLGHSTLEMTKHYVRLFNEDLVRDFQEHSPLEKVIR